MKYLRKGFTFVELMVVITIAALLFGVISVSFSTVNIKSRNSRRKADMESIRQALELCRSYSGSYPNSIYDTSLGGRGVVCGGQEYMKTSPVDPKSQADYSYTNTTTTYTISTTLMEGSEYPGGSYSVTNP